MNFLSLHPQYNLNKPVHGYTVFACADKSTCNCRPACETAIDLKVERAFVKLFYSSLCHMHTGMCRRILLMNAILH